MGEDQRSKDKSLNTQVISDSKTTEAALQDAIGKVQSFFGLDQEGATVKPSDSIKAVFGLLEQILEDSSKQRMETEQQEADQSKGFSTFMDQSEISLAQKNTARDNAVANLATSKDRRATTSEEIAEQEKLHDSHLKEGAQIQQMCNPKLSHEER